MKNYLLILLLPIKIYIKVYNYFNYNVFITNNIYYSYVITSFHILYINIIIYLKSHNMLN